MNDNTVLRIKVPAHLYESVKAQLTINEAPREVSHELLQKMLDDLLTKYGNTEMMKSNILIALRGKINDMLNNMHPQLSKFKEQLTINEAKSKPHYGAGMEVVKEKKMAAPKDGMKKVEEEKELQEYTGVNPALDIATLAAGGATAAAAAIASIVKQLGIKVTI